MYSGTELLLLVTNIALARRGTALSTIRRALLAMVMWLLHTPVAFAQSATTCPQSDSWNFPPAVFLTADVWGLNAASERFDPNPDQRAEMSCYPTGAESRLFTGPQAIGWSLVQYRWMGPEYTLLYQPSFKKASLARGFVLRGYDAMEPEITPLCWFRSLRRGLLEPGGLHSQAANDLIVYSFNCAHEKSTISVSFRPADLTIVSARSERTDHSGYSQWKYLDYQPLASGRHHPSLIQFEAGAKSGTIRSEIRLTHIEELTSAELKPAESLPQDVMIFDADRNLTLNNVMEVMPDNSLATPARISPSTLPSRGPWKTIVLCGIGLLLTCSLWVLAKRWSGKSMRSRRAD